MKKLFFTQVLLLLVVAMALITSCKDDEVVGPGTQPPLVPNLEGFYVHGTNTIAEDALDENARMSRAVLDPGQGAEVENMEGVYGKFMYIGANSTIQFTEVEGEEATVYGAAGGGAREQGSEVGNVEIDDEVIHGTLEADGPAIEVSEEGLYYLFVNTTDDIFVLSRVEPQMIGDATPGQWAEGTDIPQQSVSVEGAVYEVTGLPLSGESGYRYRFNKGWHTYASPNIVTLSSLGVEDYGTAWDTGVNDLGYFLDNIPHHEGGIFTVRLEFDAETGEWTETKTRTGDLETEGEDHSETAIGLFGNAFEVDGTEAEWNVGYEIHTPTVEGNEYTWTWENVNLIGEREFIFLEVMETGDNAPWGGYQLDFAQTTNVQGEAIDNGQIVNATTMEMEYNNYFVVEGGAYNITLTVNGETGESTATITPADGTDGSAYSDTQMGLHGNAFVYEDGTEAGWDDGYQLHAPEVDGEVHTWTWSSVDLIEGREFIFLENGSWENEAMGIDFTQATVQGAAIDNEQVVNATTQGGEWNNFFVLEGGTYDITLVIDAEADTKTVTIVPVE